MECVLSQAHALIHQFLYTVICKSLRPDTIFKPFYAMSDYLIAMQHPIWVEEEYKERKRPFQREWEREREREKQKKKTPLTNNKKLLDVITFQTVLYYAFGEINT